MRAYIQTDRKGNFFNVNAFVANEGFQIFSWETKTFYNIDEITDPDPEILIVGGIGNVRKRLDNIGIPKPPTEIDYPEELRPYFGRKIWPSTLQEIFDYEESWNIFIKPRDRTKKFTGKIFREFRDFIGVVDSSDPINVWCSEPIDFVTEWRCFIRYGEILDIRYYKGAWDSKLDLSTVKKAVHDFKTSPAAYGMDFGIDAAGKMKLVEINDGHSLGGFGISSTNYAKFLSARWAEITKTKNYLNF